jgi:glycosyltransferase involved in cell wall biosynthesis
MEQTEQQKKAPRISVILPAYQEGLRIGETLPVIAKYLHEQPYTSEILVIDDGSTDQTQDVVQEYMRHDPLVHSIAHERNRGKGAAIRTGMNAASGELALFADADNATPIQELEKLMNAVNDGNDVVIGSRYLASSKIVKKQSLIRRIMSRGGNLLFRLFLHLRFSDTRCGFKLYTKRARAVLFPRQTLERWGFDTELLIIAQHHGLRIQEVPVEWYDRERGNIRWFRDSIRSIREIFLIRRNLRSGAYD